MNNEQAIQRLERARTELSSLNAVDASSALFKKWRRDTEIAIERIFGSGTRHVPDFCSVRYTPSSYNMSNPEPAFEKAFRDGIQNVDALIQSMIQEIKEYWQDEEQVLPQEGEQCPSTTNRVFIVHGHNDSYREAVARFIERLRLEPIILHEQTDQGKTIIEKFLHYSDVSFAIILLTGDDRGGPKSVVCEDQKIRPRQNVVFELGFFIGKLGREFVCPLYEDGVELPSDYVGVTYVPLDHGGVWKMQLARELKSAGLPVDMNDVV